MRHPNKILLAILILTVLVGCNSSSSPTVPQSIQVTPSTASVTGGRSIVLTAINTDGDALIEGVTWRSSSPLVVAVDDRGTVTGGYGEGKATVTATSAEGTASALVTLVRLCADLAPIHGDPDPSKEIQTFDVEFAAGTDVPDTASTLATAYDFGVIRVDADGFTALLTPTQAVGVGCATSVVGMTYL